MLRGVVLQHLALLALLGLAGTETDTNTNTQTNNSTPSDCLCVPGDACWPSDEQWGALNDSVGGRLVKTAPVAESCYEGPSQDLDECAYVASMWHDQDFQTSDPVGRPYPYNVTCPPIDYDAGQTPSQASCSLGQLPMYVVNATEREHVSAALRWAQEHNVRLTVASTGHDILGRADGYGSLAIWLRHYRHSIDFQETYEPPASDACDESTSSGWTGAAIRIDGAYQWRDVYAVARQRGVIAVGGGSVSPGAIGGWPSGGGHGPATRNYGLGADQLLEAEVMLASGSIVLASHCSHTDLFRALRGGGPGYGVVLSATVKVYPDDVGVVTAHKMSLVPRLPETPEGDAALVEAVTTLLQSYPDLSAAGYAGYAFWFRKFPQGNFIGNSSAGYTHGFWTIGLGQDEAEEAWAPVREALAELGDSIIVQEGYTSYSSYWSFYDAESGLYDPTGTTSILTSRLIDRSAVEDRDKVREAVDILSGKPDEGTSNVVLLVSGGKVFEDAADESSGLHPAWRTSPYALITGRGLPPTAVPNDIRQVVNDDITFVKGAASKRLAPNTGAYMNEGDRNDPDYIVSFYGANYERHLAAKNMYDPSGVFYCPTCVGAEGWIDQPEGPLCRRQ